MTVYIDQVHGRPAVGFYLDLDLYFFNFGYFIVVFLAVTYTQKIVFRLLDFISFVNLV